MESAIYWFDLLVVGPFVQWNSKMYKRPFDKLTDRYRDGTILLNIEQNLNRASQEKFNRGNIAQ